MEESREYYVAAILVFDMPPKSRKAVRQWFSAFCNTHGLVVTEGTVTNVVHVRSEKVYTREEADASSRLMNESIEADMVSQAFQCRIVKRRGFKAWNMAFFEMSIRIGRPR